MRVFKLALSDVIGDKVIRYTGKFSNEPVKLLIIGILAASMSAFLSSFGVQVALLSLIIVMSQMLKISKTRAMFTLGYAATIGGTWTIIGTSLMILARSAYETAVPGDTLGMFEATKASLPIGLILIIFYCFVISRFQPDRCFDKETGKSGSEGTNAETKKYSAKDQKIVAATFIAFIVLVALDGNIFIPANMVTVLVLIVLSAAGITTVSSIVNCINWDLIIFISGVTLLSDAMVSSGVSEYIGQFLLAVVGVSKSSYIILGGLFIICAVLTRLISNVTAFGVVLPFLAVVAAALDISLKSLMITSMIACSCGFCLPLAAPSYFLLAEEGNIKVGDWMRQGLPLLILGGVLTVLLVPAIWPL